MKIFYIIPIFLREIKKIRVFNLFSLLFRSYLEFSKINFPSRFNQIDSYYSYILKMHTRMSNINQIKYDMCIYVLIYFEHRFYSY